MAKSSSILSATYLHAPGVGDVTERALWAQGAKTWDAFQALDKQNALQLSARQKSVLRPVVEESRTRLQLEDVAYFARVLPNREQWRGVGAFKRWGFLDIETDGGSHPGAITVIGLYDGQNMRAYVKGRDLNEFPRDALQFDGFVTFFGGGFDIPMLSARFPSLRAVFAERLHVDLCPLLRRLGHRGGLKSVEEQIGLRREEETRGLSGSDAVHLWRLFQRGGTRGHAALHTLLAYNRDDCINMQTLLAYALPRLKKAAGWLGEPRASATG